MWSNTLGHSLIIQGFVNLTTTDSSTSLLLEAKLPAASSYKLTMTVTFENGTFEPCIVASTCTNCYNADECQEAKNNFSDNAFKLRNQTKYGTVLEYRCPPAREFLVADNGSTVLSQNISCEWNKTWSPGVVFPPCACK